MKTPFRVPKELAREDRRVDGPVNPCLVRDRGSLA